MAKAGSRIPIKLRSTQSPHMYHTFKNKRNDPDRLQLRKYDPVIRQHAIYKETK